MKRKQTLLYSILIFVVSFMIYVLTVAPGLTFTDSGELAAVCTSLGISHPTGYPLFTLMGHLWTYIPFFSSQVYSLNIFAGFLTALSSVFFLHVVVIILNYINISRAKQRKTNTSRNKKTKEAKKPDIKISETKVLDTQALLFIAFSSAFLYSFARTIWAQATAIEVYSLHLLMMNLVLYFFFKAVFAKENIKNNLIITGLLLGLSFSNHMTTVLLLPMILFLYFMPITELSINMENDKKKESNRKQDLIEKFKFILILTIPFIVGLSLYLYLPLRAAAFPEFNWGWVSRGFDKFWYHFSGKQYQVWMFSDSTVWKDNLIKFFNMIPNETAWLGIIPLIGGLYALLRKSKIIFWGLLILILTCISYAVNYQIHDIESYFVTAIVGLILFIAIGMWYLARFHSKIYYSFLILPVMALAINYNYNDRSDDVLVPEYTKMVFGKLEPNAIILSSQWDFWLSASWYKQRIEGFRKDVIIIDKELLRRTWYVEQLKRWYPEQINKCQKEIDDYMIDLELFESGRDYSPMSIQTKFVGLLECFVASNYDEHPFYITLDVLETEPDAFKSYEKVASGFAFKLVRDKVAQVVRASDINIDRFVKSLQSNEGTMVDAIRTNAAISLVNLGRYALMQGNREEARIAFEKAYKIDSKNRFVVEAINNFDQIKFED